MDQHFVIRSSRDHLQPVVNEPSAEPSAETPPVHATTARFTPLLFPVIAAVVNTPQIEDVVQPEPAQATARVQKLQTPRLQPTINVTPVASEPQPLPEGRPHLAQPPPPVRRSIRPTNINAPQIGDEPPPDATPLSVRPTPPRQRPARALTLSPQLEDVTAAPDGDVLTVRPAPLPGKPRASSASPQVADEPVPEPVGVPLVVSRSSSVTPPIPAITITPQGADFTPLPDFHPPSVVTRADLLRRPSAVTLTPQIDDVPDEQIIAQPIARPVPQDSKALVVILTPQFERFIEKADCPRWRADETFDRRQRTDETFDRRQRADEQPERRQRAPEDPGLRECD